jgi:TonB family protein
VAAGVVRTSIVLLAGFALTGLAGRRSAALRHAVLALTLLGAGAVVPASLLLPSWSVTLPAMTRESSARVTVTPGHAVVADSDVAAPLRAPASGVARPLAAAIWAAGGSLAVVMLLGGLLRLRQIAARGTPLTDARWIATLESVMTSYGVRRRVALIEGTAPFGVATWGLRPARILLPPGAGSWSDARMRTVLSHELAHVARADWAIQIASQLVVAVLWFHPLAWLACRQLRRESERACDDVVLGQGIAAADYARDLVTFARDDRRAAWSSWMPALPMARPSAFERRITAMLNPRLDRRPLTLRSATALAAALVALTCAVASVRAAQVPSPLSGTVYDPSGAVMPGVTLTLSTGDGWRTVSTGGGTVTVAGAHGPAVQATTDSAGRFSFAGIAPGRYVLSAALPGFHELHDEFDLQATPDWDRVVTLQVGTLRETISVSATRTFAAPAAGGPSPIRVGGNIRAPLKLQDVKPVYPESMRAEGREATVDLEATITPDGSVSAVHVVSTQIHPDFAIAAIDAVRQWRYSPTLLNGKPIEVIVSVSVRFSLAD